MAAGEFDLIDRHLRALGVERADVVLGVGDDAALLDARGTEDLRVAWSSRSPAPGDDPAAIGDACVEEAARSLREAGAAPAWVTLALSLEHADEAWVSRLAGGVHRACVRHGIALVGGDTTGGCTGITVFATGPETGGQSQGSESAAVTLDSDPGSQP